MLKHLWDKLVQEILGAKENKVEDALLLVLNHRKYEQSENFSSLIFGLIHSLPLELVAKSLLLAFPLRKPFTH